MPVVRESTAETPGTIMFSEPVFHDDHFRRPEWRDLINWPVWWQGPGRFGRPPDRRRAPGEPRRIREQPAQPAQEGGYKRKSKKERSKKRKSKKRKSKNRRSKKRRSTRKSLRRFTRKSLRRFTRKYERNKRLKGGMLGKGPGKSKDLTKGLEMFTAGVPVIWKDKSGVWSFGKVLERANADRKVKIMYPPPQGAKCPDEDDVTVDGQGLCVHMISGGTGTPHLAGIIPGDTVEINSSSQGWVTGIVAEVNRETGKLTVRYDKPGLQNGTLMEKHVDPTKFFNLRHKRILKQDLTPALQYMLWKIRLNESDGTGNQEAKQLAEVLPLLSADQQYNLWMKHLTHEENLREAISLLPSDKQFNFWKEALPEKEKKALEYLPHDKQYTLFLETLPSRGQEEPELAGEQGGSLTDPLL